MKKRKPPWLKIKLQAGENYRDLLDIVKKGSLHTVCQEAQCPNQSQCWERRTATLMILGDVCTRSCGFCAVKTGKPPLYDHGEPERVALAVQKMGLVHAVITSVNRDELADGGAEIWAETIKQIRIHNPQTAIEVLIPDFQGAEEPLKQVCQAEPDILGHNVETVPRLYKRVRPQAKYPQSLWVLKRAKELGRLTKTGLMLGLGETTDEVLEVMRDCAEVGVVIFTLGQYLQPTPSHLPVERFVHPEEFEEYAKKGREMGFGHVESGPLVRSSYLADKQAKLAVKPKG